MSLLRTISFNEELHRYTDEFNIPYTSVTTVIGKYHPKFDEDYWAKRKAAEAGVSPEVIKANWKDIRDFANERGTATHKVLEDSINAANNKADLQLHTGRVKIANGQLVTINKTNLHILANSPLAEKYPKIYSFLRKHIEDGWVLFAEKRVYWVEYLLAGTIDCLLTKGKFFMIVDWKTNKEDLKFTSGYYKKVNGIKTTTWINKDERFFFPLAHLQHCKGIIYTLQLSLYAHIVELWGYKCIGLVLFHILNDEPKDPINISYLEQDVRNLATHHKTGFTYTSPPSFNTKKTSFGIT